MTPAINAAKKGKIKFTVHEYQHDPACTAYGLEAAAKLGLDTARVYKTLVVEVDNSRLAVAVVPVAAMLNLKSMARAVDSKKAVMAEKNLVMRTTGYVLGGVSPLGQKKRLATIIDASAQEFATIFVSGGKRGLDLELAPNDLAALTSASFADLTRP